MNIIRHAGDPTEAVTLNGIHVFREEKIFVLEMKAFIPCAMYGNHFIYDSGEKKKGTSPYMCTCGSIAVIVGSNVYEKDASAAGAMFVCHHHASFGKHADGSS
jgi:hypothetical protein